MKAPSTEVISTTLAAYGWACAETDAGLALFNRKGAQVGTARQVKGRWRLEREGRMVASAPSWLRLLASMARNLGMSPVYATTVGWIPVGGCPACGRDHALALVRSPHPVVAGRASIIEAAAVCPSTGTGLPFRLELHADKAALPDVIGDLTWRPGWFWTLPH